MTSHTHDVSGKMIPIVEAIPITIAKPISNAAGDMIKKLQHFKNMAMGFINVYTCGIFVLLLVVLIKYYLNQIDKEEGNIEVMEKEFKIYNPRIRALVDAEYKKNIPIRDYYVMGSFNSCAGGDTWQDWVDIKVLRKVISLGVRALDLEIYLKNGECVVAVGPEAEKGKFVLKGSYNAIKLDTVLHTINAYAFGSGAPNRSDPLFINLRIKSNKPEIYEKIAMSIMNNIDAKNRNNWFDGTVKGGTLNGSINENIKYTAYSNLFKRYQWRDWEVENLIDKPLSFIKGKAIFICNDIATNSFWGEWNDNYMGKNKNQYLFMACINISNVIGNCLPLRSFDVVYTHNPKALKKDLKRAVGLSYPDISTTGKNPKWIIHSKYGCQFTLMNFSNRDGELISYIKNFDIARKSFIVKPKHLRFFPIPLKKPIPQKKEYSYGKRKCNPKAAFMQCI